MTSPGWTDAVLASVAVYRIATDAIANESMRFIEALLLSRLTVGGCHVNLEIRRHSQAPISEWQILAWFDVAAKRDSLKDRSSKHYDMYGEQREDDSMHRPDSR